MKPNMIIIVADDMGYGDCSCFGSETIHTPNIDRIARNGVRFTDFHANGPVCSPTRAGLVTGCYQQRSGIEGVVTAKNHRHVGLPEERKTFAEVLKPQGYRTGLFGKWHLGYAPEFNPSRRGFDEFNGFVSGNIDYFSHIDQEGYEDWWNQDALTPEDGYTTDLVTRHGVRFIQENKDQPFCLYLAHECPHYPYQGPTDSGYRTPGHPEPVLGPRDDQEQAYIEMMESMDAGIGEVLDAVDKAGIAENTLVVFFSDNGPAGVGSAGPLRGKKGDLLEGGHRVPAAAVWPGTIPPGTESHVACMGMDLFPTLLAMAGMAKPEELLLDGVDILPVMKGELSDLDRALFWRFGRQKAVRRGPWKWVVEAKQGPPTALYHLDDDLSESTDVSADYPDICEAMREELADWEAGLAGVNQLTGPGRT